MTLEATLGNAAWMQANQNKIRALLPETWTHAANLQAMKLGFQLKLLGVDWRSEDEFGKCMVFFERVGLMLRDGLLVKRSPIAEEGEGRERS